MAFIMPRRSVSVLLAIGIAPVSGFAALMGTVWGFGLKCDDSCSTAPPWRDDPSAWQWNALGVVALGGFVSSLALISLVTSRRRTLAKGCPGDLTAENRKALFPGLSSSGGRSVNSVIRV